MKTRNGFVSNSSSSSFILKVGEPFQTALDVAEYMVPKREWDADAELLKKVKSLKANGKELFSVCFKSCNYDTFIAKMNGVFLIETCHNHDWDFSDAGSLSQCPPEFEEYFGGDSFYELPRSIDFYHLDYDFSGHRPEWREIRSSFCSKCYNDYWVVGEKIICPKCKTPPETK
jgi:hypothetical protein